MFQHSISFDTVCAIVGVCLFSVHSSSNWNMSWNNFAFQFHFLRRSLMMAPPSLSLSCFRQYCCPFVHFVLICHTFHCSDFVTKREPRRWESSLSEINALKSFCMRHSPLACSLVSFLFRVLLFLFLFYFNLLHQCGFVSGLTWLIHSMRSEYCLSFVCVIAFFAVSV